MPKIPKYLPNLDAIRGLAALVVILWHVELIKSDYSIPNLQALHNLGGIGVTVFFVLSGFLITYLLFKEHTSSGGIHIVKFYFRRILRIWPVYFLILAIGVFIYPRNFQLDALVMSIFFFPNVAFVMGKLPAIIDPIWSLGVEEEFYMFHPHFFRMKKQAKIFNTLIAMFFFFYALKLFASKMHIPLMQNILFFARFDCMMIGGIFSMWMANHLAEKPKFNTWLSPDFLFNKNFQRVLFISFIAYLIYGVVINPHAYSNQVLSLLTAACIVNLAFNPNCIVRLENKTLNFIGKISFGLYLMHKFPVELFTWLSVKLEITNLLLQNLFIYGLALPTSILLAYLSFHFYEAWFLRLKERKFSTH